MCDFHHFGLIFMGQMHCLPQRLKSTLFEKISNVQGHRSEEIFLKIVQPPKIHFLTFSSETKIMKITHSA